MDANLCGVSSTIPAHAGITIRAKTATEVRTPVLCKAWPGRRLRACVRGPHPHSTGQIIHISFESGWGYWARCREAHRWSGNRGFFVRSPSVGRLGAASFTVRKRPSSLGQSTAMKSAAVLVLRGWADHSQARQGGVIDTGPVAAGLAWPRLFRRFRADDASWASPLRRGGGSSPCRPCSGQTIHPCAVPLTM